MVLELNPKERQGSRGIGESSKKHQHHQRGGAEVKCPKVFVGQAVASYVLADREWQGRMGGDAGDEARVDRVQWGLQRTLF